MSKLSSMALTKYTLDPAMSPILPQPRLIEGNSIVCKKVSSYTHSKPYAALSSQNQLPNLS